MPLKSETGILVLSRGWWFNRAVLDVIFVFFCRYGKNRKKIIRQINYSISSAGNFLNNKYQKYSGVPSIYDLSFCIIHIH